MCVDTANLDSCEVHIDCDSSECVALKDPQTPEEIKAAYKHWKDHGWIRGCSHGN